MQVEYHPVTERGVSQLMYVGDVDDTLTVQLWPAVGYFAAGYIAATAKGVGKVAAITAVLAGLIWAAGRR